MQFFLQFQRVGESSEPEEEGEDIFDKKGTESEYDTYKVEDKRPLINGQSNGTKRNGYGSHSNGVVLSETANEGFICMLYILV